MPDIRDVFEVVNSTFYWETNKCGFEFDYVSEEKTDPRNGENYFVVNVKKVLT